MSLTPKQWESLSAGIFQVIHIMNLETSYQENGVIDLQPVLGPVLDEIFQSLRAEIERLTKERDALEFERLRLWEKNRDANDHLAHAQQRVVRLEEALQILLQHKDIGHPIIELAKKQAQQALTEQG